MESSGTALEDVKDLTGKTALGEALDDASEPLDSSWSFLRDVYSNEAATLPDLPKLSSDSSFNFVELPEHSGHDEHVEEVSQCPSPSTLAADESLPELAPVHILDSVVHENQWHLGVIANHSQFSQPPSTLLLPWECGVFAEIFGSKPFLDLPTSHLPEPDRDLMDRVITAVDAMAPSSTIPSDACFAKAVRNVQDLEYFENKSRQLELACGQWLELLSCNWYASGVGETLANDMQKDATGQLAMETLKASFGVKSPQTLLKRAASLRRYFKWHASVRYDSVEIDISPLPLSEPDVWDFFKWMKICRQTTGRGFTNQAAFMETVRFSKFCLDLRETDSVLQSRRLLGFSALERLQKGPTKQAPPLELIHMQRLHEVLESAECLTDRLGAGVMLVCIYGRARWSDLRYIHHVVIEEGRSGFLTLYTMEHKTSAVGARREQYLPLVIPWMGVTHQEWVRIFLDVYLQCGLNINKVPLGPLLPAPRGAGNFAARPLSTPEAAEWLRLLVAGTPDSDTFKAHSLKTTLLVWSAKAGLDKEVRAVLGHHATALQGSDVVYGRHLQTRALRKLNMLLSRVRIGLGLEEDPMAPNPFATPCARTPGPVTPAALIGAVPSTPMPAQAPAPGGQHVVEAAADEVVQNEEIESVKEELFDELQIAAAADQVSLFDLKIVDQGVVELDSSSGSESESSSSSDSSDEEPAVVRPDAYAFSEKVPDGLVYFKHKKSGIVHRVKVGASVAACGAAMTANFQELQPVLRVRLPKCLKCFPKDSNRIRSIDQLTNSLDAAISRSKRAAH